VLAEDELDRAKGGDGRTFAADSFGFGVEREMKDSGEKA